MSCQIKVTVCLKVHHRPTGLLLTQPATTVYRAYFYRPTLSTLLSHMQTTAVNIKRKTSRPQIFKKK